MKEIKPSNTSFLIIVDDEDYEYIRSYGSWSLSKNNYARCTKRINKIQKTIRLHDVVLLERMCLVKDIGQVCDHANRNPLDNRRCNLRITTPAYNNANRKLPKNSSGYRGVYKNYDKWTAQICFDSKVKHLGRFESPKDAAIAYNKKVIELYGEFAILNKIEE